MGMRKSSNYNGFMKRAIQQLMLKRLFSRRVPYDLKNKLFTYETSHKIAHAQENVY
jgi:hypothetical protein